MKAYRELTDEEKGSRNKTWEEITFWWNVLLTIAVIVLFALVLK